jgi:NAD(P)H-dependent flavin oxidoreductase YrpB (nitropropane dioxygenase family)
MKGGADYSPGAMPVEYLIERSRLCGWALALAHAKSGDPAMIAGYAGRGEALDDAIAKFALAYGEQTNRDYDALGKAARQQRIRVARDLREREAAAIA